MAQRTFRSTPVLALLLPADAASVAPRRHHPKLFECDEIVPLGTAALPRANGLVPFNEVSVPVAERSSTILAGLGSGLVAAGKSPPDLAGIHLSILASLSLLVGKCRVYPSSGRTSSGDSQHSDPLR